MSFHWDNLDFWSSLDWRTVQENLDYFDHTDVGFCPRREDMFAALDATSFEDVKVCIVGQDPYPSLLHATGLAFSIPRDIEAGRWPPTLINIIREYKSDLHLPMPESGDLNKWARQGVLLWNAYPTCEFGKPGSHHWPGWEELTKEIVLHLTKRHIVFAFLGNVANSFSEHVDTNIAEVISVSHPSPRGSMKSKQPFIGSRLFSSINSKLTDQGQKEIDWSLS